MMDSKKQLEQAKIGLDTLDIVDKFKESALKWLEIWLTDEAFKDYTPQIAYLIESDKWEFLLDSFYQVIPFGTGGRRGLVGIGPNRINLWTIQASAQGHSQYLNNQYGEEAEKSVILAYDVREYTQKGIYDDSLPNPVMNLNCKQLAIAAAQVYAANQIKVYIFDDVRSTPELSHTIRHLNACSGDMFSASHNLPTDNGKKVYDEFGGQLVPPYDQILVDQVTQKVSEIKTITFEEAKAKQLVQYIGEEVDKAYYDAVCATSLSQERDLKILYSPLHGTGITSVYPILKQLKFDVTLDPATSNLSGAFENVIFNIPNPEVKESFNKSLPHADKINADLLISTDPDADRFGVMVKHKGSWKFLNGNEIGVLLTDYGISKFKAKGLLNKDCTIIKTVVTTSLVQRIALHNNIRCIGDLLVGFKYVAYEMNKLEKENKIQHFILGTEESHGYIAGNYCRDKDAASAAVWLCEMAAELKKEKKTLVDSLEDIFTQHGYCHNYLTEIRLLGAKGMGQISSIMDHLRQNNISTVSEFTVKERIDKYDGEPQPHLSITDTASRNVLIFYIDNIPGTQSIKITVRPSGTEPKIKMYFEVFGNPAEDKQKVIAIREKLEKAFMQYCYKFLGVDFPDRGFLLFDQLPLNDKLNYFKIEEHIVKLGLTEDKEIKREKLFLLLKFLGANPIEKVNKAFSNKYHKSVTDYLNIEL
jgi:phosphoglucomutase